MLLPRTTTRTTGASWATTSVRRLSSHTCRLPLPSCVLMAARPPNQSVRASTAALTRGADDQTGAVTAAQYAKLSLRTLAKPMLSVPGNHDYWVRARPRVLHCLLFRRPLNPCVATTPGPRYAPLPGVGIPLPRHRRRPVRQRLHAVLRAGARPPAISPAEVCPLASWLSPQHICTLPQDTRAARAALPGNASAAPFDFSVDPSTGHKVLGGNLPQIDNHFFYHQSRPLRTPRASSSPRWPRSSRLPSPPGRVSGQSATRPLSATRAPTPFKSSLASSARRARGCPRSRASSSRRAISARSPPISLARARGVAPQTSAPNLRPSRLALASISPRSPVRCSWATGTRAAWVRRTRPPPPACTTTSRACPAATPSTRAAASSS